MAIVKKYKVKDSAEELDIELIKDALKEAKKTNEGYTIKGLMVDYFDVNEEDIDIPAISWSPTHKITYNQIKRLLSEMVSEGSVKRTSGPNRLVLYYIK